MSFAIASSHFNVRPFFSKILGESDKFNFRASSIFWVGSEGTKGKEKQVTYSGLINLFTTLLY